MTDYTQYIGKLGWLGEPDSKEVLGVLSKVEYITTHIMGTSTYRKLTGHCQINRYKQRTPYFDDAMAFGGWSEFTPITLEEWIELGKQLIAQPGVAHITPGDDSSE